MCISSICYAAYKIQFHYLLHYLPGCKVSPECYGLLTHWLHALAGGRMVLCLEGGYNLNSIAYAMTMCSKALLGDPLPMLECGSIASPSGIQSIRIAAITQAKYWSCLRFEVSCRTYGGNVWINFGADSLILFCHNVILLG